MFSAGVVGGCSRKLGARAFVFFGLGVWLILAAVENGGPSDVGPAADVGLDARARWVSWGEEETELDIRKRETDTRTAWNGRMSGSSVVDVVVVVNYSWEEAREAHAARAMQGRERERGRQKIRGKRWNGNLGLGMTKGWIGSRVILKVR